MAWLTNDQIDVPGLEKVNSQGENNATDSPLAIMTQVADERIKAAELVLQESALNPRAYFFSRGDDEQYL